MYKILCPLFPVLLLSTTFLSADDAAIDSYVQMQMKETRIPGLALAIIRGDKVVYLRGYNTEGARVTPQTPFILGSVSKSITALAAMQLVEQNRIELDAPVGQYLPWFQALWGNSETVVTVRQILNQNGGIAPYFDNTVDAAMSINDLVRGPLNGRQLKNAPGREWIYSNANYIIAGAVIEAASGQTYGEYVKEHVFGPLKMRHSYASKQEAKRDGLAAGHRFWFGFPCEAELPYFQSSLPAGYVVSSAEDMAHYLLALMNEGRYGSTAVVSSAGVAQLFKPQVKAYTPVGVEATQTWYGMGWMVNLVGAEVNTIAHTGETANYHAHALMKPREHLGVVVLDNVSGMISAGQIAPGVLAIAAGGTPPERKLTPRRLILVFLALSVFSALLVAVAVVRLRSFKARIGGSRLRLAFNAALAALINVGLPIFLLLRIPDLVDAPWRAVVFFSPDASLTVIGLSVALLVVGALKVWMIAVLLTTRAHQRTRISALQQG